MTEIDDLMHHVIVWLWRVLTPMNWYRIARFLGVFGINTASDIQNSPKYHEPPAAASDIWGVLKYREPVFVPNTPKKPCYFLFILQGKEISHLT